MSYKMNPVDIMVNSCVGIVGWILFIKDKMQPVELIYYNNLFISGSITVGYASFTPKSLFTLQMLGLLSSKAQGCNDFQKPSKPCHVGIHLIALREYSHMCTHMPGFQ